MKSNILLVFCHLCVHINFMNSQATERSILDLQDYSFIPGTMALYKLHKEPETWYNAKEICESEGSKLFYPENDDEAKSVISFWPNATSCFVGISKSKNGFETIDGNPISWHVRDANMLDDDEACAVFYFWEDWFLNNDFCNSFYHFICKYPIAAVRRNVQTSILPEINLETTTPQQVIQSTSTVTTWDRQCNMPYLDYTYSEQFSTCYKLHVTPKNWTEARDKCLEENSHLAVINSPQEAEYLAWLKNSIKQRIPGKYTRGVILLGFHKNDQGVWQTVDGTKLENSGYNLWGNNKPEARADQQCGSMFYNGHLNDIECEREALFICEHSPGTNDIVTEKPSRMFSVFDLKCYCTS